MTKIKKLFSPETARIVIKISLILWIAALLFGLAVNVRFNQKAYLDPDGEYLPMLYVVFLSVLSPLGEWEDLSFFNLLYKLPYSIMETVELVLFIIYVAAIVIKLIDYRLSIGDNEKNEKKRVFNVLGIIALPVWTAYVGMSLYRVVYEISLFAFERVNMNLYVIISFSSYALIFAIPIFCVFICSLVLDIAGLRSEAVAQRKED